MYLLNSRACQLNGSLVPPITGRTEFKSVAAFESRTLTRQQRLETHQNQALIKQLQVQLFTVVVNGPQCFLFKTDGVPGIEHKGHGCKDKD